MSGADRTTITDTATATVTVTATSTATATATATATVVVAVFFTTFIATVNLPTTTTNVGGLYLFHPNRFPLFQLGSYGTPDTTPAVPHAGALR